MSLETLKQTITESGVPINYPNVKLIKKTEDVKKIFSEYIEDFLVLSPDDLSKWNSFENLNAFRHTLDEKKMKMRNPNKVEDEKQKKLDKKLKREQKAKDRQEQKVKKAMDRPKKAYYYFMQDEKDKVRQKLINAGYKGNAKTLKKNIHVELQNMWTVIKKEKNSIYTKYKAMEEEAVVIRNEQVEQEKIIREDIFKKYKDLEDAYNKLQLEIAEKNKLQSEIIVS